MGRPSYKLLSQDCEESEKECVLRVELRMD